MPPLARKPHTEFALSDATTRKLILAMASAYSGNWNPRGLESYFYGVWDMVLCDLINDLPLLFVIPQHTIGTVDDGPVFPDVDLQDVSMMTTAAANAKSVLPDFVVMCAEYSIRGNGRKEYVHMGSIEESDTGLDDSDANIDFIPPGYIAIPHISGGLPQNILNSHLVKIENLLVCLVAEIKRCPTRHATSLTNFTKSLASVMTLARTDAETQAEQAFNSQQVTKKLLMVAACGEWWSWQIVEKGMYESNGNDADFFSDSENNPSHEESFSHSQDSGAHRMDRPPRRTAALATKGTFTDPSSPKISAMDLLPAHAKDKGGDKTKPTVAQRYLNLGAHMQSAVGNIDEGKPLPADWSKYLLLGTEASNQALFLIHQTLQNLGTT
ncbi:hypothetical protein BDQ12DRAFT_715114 [Crucibulum laeve]|uniref:Uncharacterized protein n=1 Tax=Crucibulum laeve TaxID=68775 RepID=A0A5C3LR29_9AGAR|nr:hypothetical protein BDQ12DRAFT_715114 [Crucibulum laeve]